MLFILLVLLLSVFYLYLRYVYSYWSRHGFPYLQPWIPIGNLTRVAKREQGFNENLFELHTQTSEPFVGIYMLFKPALLVRDPTLIQRMLVNDFPSFHDRGVYCDPKNDPLSNNIFGMSGDQWKMLRSKLTPVFTSGKMKAMLPMIMREGDRLMTHLEKPADGREVIEIKDLTSRYISEYVLNFVLITFLCVDIP